MDRARTVSGSMWWTVGIVAAAFLLLWPFVGGSNEAADGPDPVSSSPRPLQDGDRDDPPPRVDQHDEPCTPVALPAPSPGGDGVAAERSSTRRVDLAVRSPRLPRPIPGRRLAAQRTECATRPEPCRPIACPTRGPPRA